MAPAIKMQFGGRDVEAFAQELKEQFIATQTFEPETVIQLVQYASLIELNERAFEDKAKLLEAQLKDLKSKQIGPAEIAEEGEKLRQQLDEATVLAEQEAKERKRVVQENVKLKEVVRELEEKESPEVGELRDKNQRLAQNNRALTKRLRDLKSERKEGEDLQKQLADERKRTQTLTFQLRAMPKTSPPSSKEMERELIRLTEEKYQPMMNELYTRMADLEKTEKRDDTTVRKLIEDVKELRQKYDGELSQLRRDIEKKGSLATFTDKLDEKIRESSGPGIVQVRRMIQRFTESEPFKWEVRKIITRYLSELEAEN